MPEQRVDALIARLEKGMRKTLQFFGGLSAEQWEQVLYTDPCSWTVRDLLAHFVSSEQGLLSLVQDVAAGGQGVPDGYDYDAFNALGQERLADRSARAKNCPISMSCPFVKRTFFTFRA